VIEAALALRLPERHAPHGVVVPFTTGGPAAAGLLV
jgi:hypothetical protein